MPVLPPPVLPLPVPHRWVPSAEVVLAAVLAAGAVVAVAPRPALAGLLWLAWATPRLTAIDIAEHRLPDRLVLPGYPVLLAVVLTEAATGAAAVPATLALAAGYGLLLLLLHGAGGMGLGDVKLAPVLGLAAGAVSPAAAVAAPLLAFLVGGVVALVALVRFGRGAPIPFGPAMLLGAWTAVLTA